MGWALVVYLSAGVVYIAVGATLLALWQTARANDSDPREPEA